jgi:protein-S-isoprenylcysteine O-methyltransferase Ste14
VKKKDLVRAVIGFSVYLFVVPALLFISAGTLNWPMAWAYTLLSLTSTLVSRLVVLFRNPDTLLERAKFASSKGTKSGDRGLVVVVALLAPMSMMIVAGLDHRFNWSMLFPETIQILAAMVIALGYGLGVWAMVVNRYFSAVVRIQDDRGHVVVTAGPYRIVRHPAYAGALLASLALPVMLDSIWAMIPVLITEVGIIMRTRLEDQMLRDELDGYQAYSERTRYRLIPGVW